MAEHREAIRSIMLASNVLDGVYTLAAKKVRMKENTLTLLYALDDGREHSQVEISRQWMIPKTTLNTIVKECIRDGLIVLVPSQGTKEKQIRLTEQGRDCAHQALSAVYRLEETAYRQTTERFSPEFTEALTCFCRCLGRQMEEYFREDIPP